MDKTDIIIFGALICIVIILFITVSQNKKIGNVIQTLNSVENFDITTTTTSSNAAPSIKFKTVCGDINNVNIKLDKVPFYNADDYHILELINMPDEFFKTESITVNFIYNVTNDIKTYIGKELEAIKTVTFTPTVTTKKITLKQTLYENAKYILKLTTAEGTEIKFSFVTDYNIFTYNPLPPGSVIGNYDDASKYLLLGIKQRSNSDYNYQVANTSVEAFIPVDGIYI
jgi:hypothetical protein